MNLSFKKEQISKSLKSQRSFLSERTEMRPLRALDQNIFSVKKKPKGMRPTYFTEFFTGMMRKKCFEGLKTGIDTLHAPTFVTVGNFSPDFLLLFQLSFRGQRTRPTKEKQQIIY